MFEVNTANEYWRSDGFLVHGDPLGQGDLAVEPGTRTYMMAGCQHGPGMPMLLHRSPLSPEQRVGNLMGTLAYQNLTRAALVNLAEWVEEETEPPPQTTPTLAGETAAPRTTVLEQIARIPGAYTIAPETLTELTRQTDGRSHPAFVSAVDADGNEIAGIRLPEIQVPASGMRAATASTAVPPRLCPARICGAARCARSQSAAASRSSRFEENSRLEKSKRKVATPWPARAWAI